MHRGRDIKCTSRFYTVPIVKEVTEKQIEISSGKVWGFFRKNASNEFIAPVQKEGLHIITKTRSDVNLMYLFKGKQKPGRGRKKLYDGKINTAKIDKRLPCCYADEDMKVYGEAKCIVYC